MSSLMHNNDDDDEEFYSYAEEENESDDDLLNNDLKALREALTLTGKNPNDFEKYSPLPTEVGKYDENDDDVLCESDENNDLELFKNIKNRFSNDSFNEPIYSKPLCTLPPFGDDDDADFDFETLCAVQRRFSAYESKDIMTKRVESVVHKPKEEKSPAVFADAEESGPLAEFLGDGKEMEQCGYLEQGPVDVGDHDLISLGLKDSTRFPKSAHVFLDAIKKNRSCQKFLRSKLAHIELRVEENKKLMERVKVLRDLHVSCRKSTGRALAQGKDPRIQLISARKMSKSRDSKDSDKKLSAMNDGPVENSHATNYKKVFERILLTRKHKKWTKEEKENLRKGIRQQFQEMLLQFSADRLSGSEQSPGYANDWDAILPSIRDLEITPEMCREFLPKVNWDQLASLYVANHSAAECEAQWLNNEDPLINNSRWTSKEEKKLLFIVQNKGLTNWLDISKALGNNRTPFQCLARFQRSLRAGIIKSVWTREEDDQLQIAVEMFGENDWQSVASTLRGRTGSQCSNRWKKTLDPTISRSGRWTLDESKRLTVAAMIFGPVNWNKIAQFLPGRTGVKCRERWFNCLDPSLDKLEWTEEEDSKLISAAEECGYKWSYVAKFLPPRTDNQCWRRWKVLCPDKVHLLQEAKRMQKAALITNFVDRESERPALGPHDFVPLPMIKSGSEGKDMHKYKKSKRKTREGAATRREKNASSSNSLKRRRTKRLKNGIQVSSSEELGITNSIEVEKFSGNDSVVTEGRTQFCSENPSHTAQALGSKHRKKKKTRKSNLERSIPTKKETGECLEDNCMSAGAITEISESSHNQFTEQEDAVGRRDTSCQVSKPSMKRKLNIESVVLSPVCDGNRENNKASKFRTAREVELREGNDVASAQREKHKKLKSMMKKCSKMASDTNDDDNVTLASLITSVPDGRSMSKQRSKTFGKRNLVADIEDNSPPVSTSCQVDRPERLKLGIKPCSKRSPSGNSDEDNMALGKWLQVKRDSESNRGSGTNDEEEDTLASFIKNRSKKRRIN